MLSTTSRIAKSPARSRPCWPCARPIASCIISLVRLDFYLAMCARHSTAHSAQSAHQPQPEQYRIRIRARIYALSPSRPQWPQASTHWSRHRQFRQSGRRNYGPRLARQGHSRRHQPGRYVEQLWRPALCRRKRTLYRPLAAAQRQRESHAVTASCWPPRCTIPQAPAPTTVATRAATSSKPARTRCAACRPTASTSTNCTARRPRSRSKRRSTPLTCWCATERCSTSARPHTLPGS